MKLALFASFIAASALLGSSSAAAQTLYAAPHLTELAPDGFSVHFETDATCDAIVELQRGHGAFTKIAQSCGRVHHVRIAGLQPLEPVRYRIVVAGKVLAEAATRSGPSDAATSLDFLVYGDTRDGLAVERATIEEARAFAPAFAVHTGDIVPLGGSEPAWRAILANEQTLWQETPIYLAVGNHELLSDPATLARRFLPPPGSGPLYYTFRSGPASFVVLDSNHLDATQLAWVERTLSKLAHEAGKPHVFVVFHHPPFSMGDHCGAWAQESALLRLFDRYRPSAVFTGHDHAYERLQHDGIRYFVSGGGGAPLYEQNRFCSEADHLALELYRAEYHFLRVRIRGATVEVVVERPGETPIETVRWRD